MPSGPGKYDAEATTVRLRTRGRAVMVMVIEGIHGSGFSIQIEGDGPTSLALMSLMEMTLQKCAGELHADIERIMSKRAGDAKRG